MNGFFDIGNDILSRQPFSILLGAELVKFEPGLAELALCITERLKQQHGFVHGGVISYLADNCLTYAGGSVIGDCVTSEYKINYARPAIGERLVAKGSVLSFGKSQAVCQCQVLCFSDGEEKLVAVAQGTIAKVASTR